MNLIRALQITIVPFLILLAVYQLNEKQDQNGQWAGRCIIDYDQIPYLMTDSGDEKIKCMMSCSLKLFEKTNHSPLINWNKVAKFLIKLGLLEKVPKKKKLSGYQIINVNEDVTKLCKRVTAEAVEQIKNEQKMRYLSQMNKIEYKIAFSE